MRKFIYSATKHKIIADSSLITKDMIRNTCGKHWSLQIDAPDLIGWANDDYAFYAVDLNKAVDFLNSPKGQEYIEEMEGIYGALLEAQWDYPECGVTRYTLPDSFDRNDAIEIARLFKKVGQEVPEWLYG